MKKIINAKNIEIIHVVNERQCSMVKYYPKEKIVKKFLGITIKETESESEWVHSFTSYKTRDEVVQNNNTLYIKDDEIFENSIWEKPFINIKTSSDRHIQHFDTIEDLDSMLTKLMMDNQDLIVIKS